MPMIYEYEDSTPVWINFENPKGAKGCGGTENSGAKGHAFEHFHAGEEKVLCDLQGSGVVRRIWLTINDRSESILKNVTIKMVWDNAQKAQVECPLGDSFCMGLGKMRSFENCFFSTAEGRSFCCFIPMPFKTNCRIVLVNGSGMDINNLFYDINISLERITDNDMYFHAVFRETEKNDIEEDVEILSVPAGAGRFLGCSIAVIPDEDAYGDLWWGEGEVKIYLDGDTAYPSLVGTGTEDYIGSAWELGEFIGRTQGCVCKEGMAASFYRFHVEDKIYFKKDIRVKLQAMGGGDASKVKKVMERGIPCIPVSFDDGDIHHIYKQENSDLRGYTNFFRQDHYRVTAYYYRKSE